MSGIELIVGPPGTGKTTYLARQAERAAAHYDGSRVLVTSLTRAAASTIAARLSTIPDHNVGTLHAMCYRQMRFPEIATAKKHLVDWNSTFPHWTIVPTDATAEDTDETSVAATISDVPNRVDVMRHRQTDRVLWNEECTAFHDAWTRYKADRDLFDFTDLIEQVAGTITYPPSDAAVMIVDEAQDLSPLEMQVITRWSEHVETTMICGDADQVLYDWRGADPQLFRPGALADDHVRVLEQSYRVPAAAHRAAVDLIEQCENRRKIQYRPTEVEGKVISGAMPFATPGDLVDLAEAHANGTEDGDIMFIAPCGFSLYRLIKQFRSRGIPFHNPYRRRQGAWNPLATRKGVTIPDRLLAFTALARTGRAWTIDELRAWVTGLSSDRVLKRGVKTGLDAPDFKPPQSVADLQAMLKEPSDANAIIAGDLGWYGDNCQAALIERMEYPMLVAKHRGVEALRGVPKVIIGTIHSVKGGEAETVVLSPDLSNRGMETFVVDPDALRRLFYVGMTRCRRNLHLCRPSVIRQTARFWN